MEFVDGLLGFFRGRNNFRRGELSSQARIEIHAASRASERHPNANEDATLTMEDAFALADGAGGAAGGKIASELAIRMVRETLQRNPTATVADAERTVRLAIMAADRAVFSEKEKAKRREGLAWNQPDNGKMATTLSVVQLVEEAPGRWKAVVGNVGDSRVYVLRADGRLEQITLDDGVVKGIFKDPSEARRVQQKLANITSRSGLNPSEQLCVAQSNFTTKMVGDNFGADVQTQVVQLNSGDVIFATSDGFHDPLTDNQIAAIVKGAQTSEEAANRLTQAAVAAYKDPGNGRLNGKTEDDMSIVQARIVDGGTAKKGGVASPQASEGQEEPKKPGWWINVGTEVFVDRSNGIVDGSWVVKGWNSTIQQVVVQKIEGGETLQRTITWERLLELNPEPNQAAQAPRAEASPAPEAASLAGIEEKYKELYAYLRSVPEVRTSVGMIPTEDLIALIEDVRGGRAQIETITRTYNLRKTVGHLLALEAQARKGK